MSTLSKPTRDLPRADITSAGASVSIAANLKEQLFALQLAQFRHDERYHRDIVLLPVGDRMKHMALHIAKYAGGLIEAIQNDDADRYRKIAIDAFIIALASANTLNLNLKDAFAQKVADVECSVNFAPNANEFDFVHRLMVCAGEFAKACESLDHVEKFPFREEMAKSVAAIAGILVQEAAHRGWDLVPLMKDRLREVERRNMFDAVFQAEVL